MVLPPAISVYFDEIHVHFNQTEYNFAMKRSDPRIDTVDIANPQKMTLFGIQGNYLFIQ